MISKGYLDDAEARALIEKYLEGIAPNGATQHDLVEFVVWAENQRLGAILVEMILEDRVVVGAMKDGAPVVYAPGGDPKTETVPLS